MALAGIACAAMFMVATQPPPAAKVTEREAPSRTLAYEQAVSGTDTPSEGAETGQAEKPTEDAQAETVTPSQPPADANGAERDFPALPQTAQSPEPAAAPPSQTPADEPRVAAVPPQAPADAYAGQPPMHTVPPSHESWAPPDEGASEENYGAESYGQDADQWGAPAETPWNDQGQDQGQGQDQWGNDAGDQGYDQGLNNYDGYDQQDGQGPDQGNEQWANAPPPGAYPPAQGSYPPGSYPPSGAYPPPPGGQWGAAPPPGQPGQWADQNTETGEQWVQVVSSGAEMRSAAADDAPPLFSFPYGRSLKVISFQEGWAQVSDPQSAATGWMKVQFLAPAASPNAASRPQYDAYYEEPPRRRRGLFNGGFGDMINRAFGNGGN